MSAHVISFIAKTGYALLFFGFILFGDFASISGIAPESIRGSGLLATDFLFRLLIALVAIILISMLLNMRACNIVLSAMLEKDTMPFWYKSRLDFARKIIAMSPLTGIQFPRLVRELEIRIKRTEARKDFEEILRNVISGRSDAAGIKKLLQKIQSLEEVDALKIQVFCERLSNHFKRRLSAIGEDLQKKERELTALNTALQTVPDDEHSIQILEMITEQEKQIKQLRAKFGCALEYLRITRYKADMYKKQRMCGEDYVDYGEDIIRYFLYALNEIGD